MTHCAQLTCLKPVSPPHSITWLPVKKEHLQNQSRQRGNFENFFRWLLEMGFVFWRWYYVRLFNNLCLLLQRNSHTFLVVRWWEVLEKQLYQVSVPLSVIIRHNPWWTINFLCLFMYPWPHAHCFVLGKSEMNRKMPEIIIIIKKDRNEEGCISWNFVFSW